ncbi:MAG: right-handed parallel beta-helix repeat-containing protein [Methanomassiliicoccus sp.]|nr:right-handed parallel beta-helix repeat-containing protein [Methanomassiliicoccus sp.]
MSDDVTPDLDHRGGRETETTPKGPPVDRRRRKPGIRMVMLVAAIVIVITIIVIFYPFTVPAISGPVTTPTTPTVFDYTITGEDGTYNVTDTDGVPFYTGDDASAAIQTALDSMTSERTAKEAVLLEGDFIITETIHIPSYTILVLNGTVTWGSDETGYMLTASGQKNFEVQGGEWNGSREERSATSGSNPMEFNNCHDLIIANLQIHDGAYDNIECMGCTNVAIVNVESYNSTWDSFMMAWCSNSLIDRCHIHDSDQGGCYFYCEDDGIVQHIDNNIMRNNRVERTLTSGLSLSPRGAEDIVSSGLIENNTCIDCGQDSQHPGINVGWNSTNLATNTVVRNNLIYSTSSAGEGGIELAGDGCQCYGNTINDTPGYAIHLVGINNRVTNNAINHAGWNDSMAGISIVGSNNVVTGNTITNCPSFGIRVYSGSGNTISPNTFSGNGRDTG